MTMEDMEMTGDAWEVFKESFGKDYEPDQELHCPDCGSYGACDCEGGA
jgi:hypothetical protein